MGGRLTVGVVGAGIGGLTTALAVRRAGHEVVCFERAQELNEVGAGIQIGPNASRLLHRLGLAEPLAAVAVQPTRLQFRRWSPGAVIKEIVAGPDVAHLYGAPYYTLHRADLHRILTEAQPPGTIRLDATCVGADQHNTGVELRFADGTQHRADVVIGADGLGSQLRQLMDLSRPRFSGKAAWRVLVPADAVAELADPPIVRMWLGPGKHLVSYPICAGRLLNLAGALPATAAEAESWTREGPADEFAAALDGWDPDLHTILAAATTTLRLPLFDRPTQARPGLGRITLLGDAAHPMLPYFAQGAAQAIEDAWVLGRCLEGATRPTAVQALRRYEQARATRTAKVQRRSRRNGQLFQLTDGLKQRP